MNTTSFLSLIDKTISQVGPVAKLINSIARHTLSEAPAQAGCSFCYSFCQYYRSGNQVCVVFNCGGGCSTTQCGYAGC